MLETAEQYPVLPKQFLLLVGDTHLSRSLVRFIKDDWPDAEIVLQAPQVSGIPDTSFPWQDYDVLFLQQGAMPEEALLNWLGQMKQLANFPATIFLGRGESPQLAVSAIKAGADEFLVGRQLSRSSVYRAVIDAILYASSDRAAELRQRHAVLGPVIEGVQIEYSLSHSGAVGLYLATWRELREKVVVKSLLREQPAKIEQEQRFTREARWLSQLQSKYIARVYDYGETTECLYMITQYYPAGSLRERLRTGALSAGECLSNLAELARGLQALHSAGIVHRDVKPANIMYREDGGLALIDLGIARELDRSDDELAEGEWLGTPAYMSPEHVDISSIDVRSDIYSAGVVLYEMLTGQKPYTADNVIALIRRHASDPLPQLSSRLQVFQSLLNKMLAKKPIDRFQSAAELLGAVTQLQAAGDQLAG